MHGAVRLDVLRECHDWFGLRLALSEALEAAPLGDDAARLNFELGELFAHQLSRPEDACRHYRAAFERDPTLRSALGAARTCLRELGRFADAQQLLEEELSLVGSESGVADLWLELADLRACQGQADEARAAFDRACAAMAGPSPEPTDAADPPPDSALGLSDLLAASSPEVPQRALVRAAQVVACFCAEQAFTVLARVYQEADFEPEAAVPCETELVASGRGDELLELQRQSLENLPDARARSCRALAFGRRWRHVHASAERAVELAELSLLIWPDNEQAFAFLVDACRSRLYQPARAGALAESLRERASPTIAGSYLASLAHVAGAELQEPELAARCYQLLARVAPDHSALVRESRARTAGEGGSTDWPVGGVSEPPLDLDIDDLEEMESREDEPRPEDAGEAALARRVSAEPGDLLAERIQPLDEQELDVGDLLEEPGAEEALGSAETQMRASEPPGAPSSHAPRDAALPGVFDEGADTSPPQRDSDSAGPAAARRGAERPWEPEPESESGTLGLGASGASDGAPGGEDGSGSAQGLRDASPAKPGARPETRVSAPLLSLAESAGAAPSLPPNTSADGSENPDSTSPSTAITDESFAPDEDLPTSAPFRRATVAGSHPTSAAEPAPASAQPESVPGSAPDSLASNLEPTLAGSSDLRKPPAMTAPSDPPSPLEAPSETLSTKRPRTSSAAPRRSSSLPAVGDVADVDALQARLEEQKSRNRLHEYVKTLVLLGDALEVPEERVARYLEAAELYATKFMNQAEAVKAHEKILDLQPNNDQSRQYLVQMYERRRDWEKLINLRNREAEGLSLSERHAVHKELAELADQRIKKPALCIGLWQRVLEGAPDDLDALESLSKLYERTRDYERLADALEQLSRHQPEEARVPLLTKLAQVVGDRLKNDARAIEVYKELIALNPNDRRSQEQLKRRYLALGCWDELEGFYEESGRWEEFIRLLESSEARCQDPAQRVELLRKVAQLWQTKRDRPERAARAYEKVLEVDPRNWEAAEQLLPIYERANNAAGLARSLEVQLAHPRSAGERVEMHRRLAALYESRLAEPKPAFAHFRAAFDEEPGNPEFGDDMERAASASGDWEAVVESYAAGIETATQQAELELVTSLRLRLGRVYLAELSDSQRAIETYSAVLETAPHDADALDALEQLYLGAERHADLLEIYARRRELAETPEQQAQVLLRTAQLHHQRLGDPERAIESYQRVLSLDSDSREALAALDELLFGAERYDEQAAILEQRLQVESEEELLDLKFRLAEVQNHRLEAPALALHTYKDVLALSPSHAGARAALEALLKHPELDVQAAELLEQIYEGSGDSERLLEVTEVLATRAEGAQEKVRLWGRVAAVAEQRLGNTVRAFQAQARALRAAPSDEQVREELERLAPLAEQRPQLGELYLSLAEELAPLPEARRFRLWAAANDQELGNFDAAVQSLERLLELDPTDVEALDTLESIHRRSGNAAEVVAVLDRQLQFGATDEQAIALHERRAEVFLDHLGKPVEAVEAYRAILLIDPARVSALASLESLYKSQERWAELCDVLSSRLGLEDDPDESRKLRMRMAELYQRNLEQPDNAIDIYQDVLVSDPYDDEALASLEGLAQNPRLELSVSEILEPLYQQRGDYDKLIGVYEVQVRQSTDTVRKVELLHRIAGLHEDVAANFERATDALSRALALDPLNESTVESLERIARSTATQESLAKTYQDLAEHQAEPALAAHLYSAAAQVLEREVADSGRAVALYRKVLELEPEKRAALDSLERLLKLGDNHEALSLLLQQKSAALDDLAERKVPLYEAGVLERDVLDRPQEATKVYESILELDPDDAPALEALSQLYLELSNWRPLLAVQQRTVELAESVDDKKGIYYQMGAVYERELEDLPKAIDIYQKVLELDPDDLPALGRLDVLYQAEANWHELLTVLAHEAELASDPSESVSYQYRIAELYERRLGDASRAIELYSDVLVSDPEHGPTLAALELLKEGPAPYALAAARAVESIYEALADWPRLVSALEVQSQHSEDVFEIVELYHRIAGIYEQQLADPASAFDWFARAVARDTRNERSLSELERLASGTMRWPDVASLYEEQFQKIEDYDHRVELGLRLAQIYEVQLGDVASAVAGHRSVLEIEAENQQAIRALGRLFGRTERWAELAEVLKLEVGVGHSPDEILESKFRLGKVYQEHLDKPAEAVTAFEEVLGSAPEHEAARAALEELFEAGVLAARIANILEPLYEAAGEWEALVDVHEAQLAALTASEERLALYLRLAEDYEDRLLDSEQAFVVMTRALGERPLDSSIREILERLADTFDEGWEELANAFADVMSVEGVSQEVQAEVGGQLARVFEDQLQDIGKAEEAYRYVLTVAPGDDNALENLDRIYLALERWGELAGVLEQRAAASDETGLRVDLYLRLGRVYEDQLEQPEAALRAYRLIFDDLEPSNPDVAAALVDLYEARSEWEQLEAVYRRQLDIALGDVEQAEVRAKLAGLHGERLGRADEAIEGWKRVLDLRGEDSGALESLATLYQDREQWAELGDVLERLYDVAFEDDDRINALTRRARLFTEALGRPEEALETWQRVLDIDFSNVAALRSIATLRRGAGEHRDLVDALHQLVERCSDRLDGEEIRETYRELATIYRDELDEPGESAESFRRLLEVDECDLPAMEALEGLYRKEDRWPEVVEVKVQRASALDEPEEKVEQLLEAAAIWKEEVKENDQAVDVLQRVLRVDPSHRFAFQELEKLHTLAERWEPLIELYLGRLDAVEEPSERSGLLRRISRVFERHLDDDNQAFDALLSALAEDYGDEETAGYLERMAQSTNRWGELISTTNEWMKGERDDKRRIQLCLRLGKWYGENLGRPDYAQPYYTQIHKLDPNNAQVLRQIAHIHRQGGHWKEMGESLRKALEVAVSNDDRKVILVDLGSFLDHQMKERVQAVAHYRQALELDAYYLPALDALEAIYSEQEAFEDLAAILSRKTEAVREPPDVAQVQLRLGEVRERHLSDWRRAASAYGAVVAYDDSNLMGLRGLQRVYQKLERWSDIVDVLERQLAVVDTDRERVEALLQLADIQEKQFLKADAAAGNLERVLDIDPTEVRAFEALERCYRKLKQWEDFVATCERHILEVSDPEGKADLYEKIAKVYSDEAEDTHRAIEAYLNIAALDGSRLSALEALSRLYESDEDYHQSIEYMARVADLTTDLERKVDMYHRIGLALEQKLGDRAQARERFESVLDLRADHLPTLAALREMAREEGDWEEVAQLLEREQRNTQSARARARHLVELGRVRDEALNDRAAASKAYEEAISYDPECEEAAEPLLREYVAGERWAQAAPLAEMLVRRGKGRPVPEQHAFARTLGKVEQAQANYKEALKGYQLAHQLDVTDVDTLRGLASVLFELKDWPASMANYQKVLSALGEGEIEERTEVYFRIGKIKENQSQIKQALGNFEKALSLDPLHRPTLEAMVEHHQALADWEAVAGYLRRILDDVLDDSERWSLLHRIAEVWGERQNDARRAIEALEEARDIRPRDSALQHKLLQYYQKAGDWRPMVETLSAIAELESHPERQARYLYTMAQVYRDKLDDKERAVELFNEALDLSPEFLEAFERINKILTQSRDWKQLERQYRKMLHRISGRGKQQLEFTLWHQLGLVYRDRLSQVQPALEAFKMASSLDSDNRQERTILSELYELAGEHPKAIEQQQFLTVRQPLSVAPYQALFRLHMQQGNWDGAWCAAAVLAFMQQAGPEETEFFTKHKQAGLPVVRGRLASSQWLKHLRHPDADTGISGVFESLLPAALRAKVAMLQATGKLPVLDKKYRQDPNTSTVTFAKTFFWAAQSLGIVQPELFVRSDVPGPVTAVVASTPASVAGQTVLKGFSPQELTFICGKHLARYRKEYYLTNLFPTYTELTILLYAGVGLASPNTPMPAEMAQHIRMTALELGRFIQPVEREQLRAAVKSFMDAGARAQMKHWTRAVELTSARAGLTLCADLEIAKKVLAAEETVPGGLRPADKMKDMLAFMVSDEMSALRQALGVAVSTS